MFSKKIKIIILAIIIFLFIFFIFGLKIDIKNVIDGIYSGISEKGISKTEDKINTDNNKEAESKIDVSVFEKLKNNHPEFSSSQLEFYSDTAVNGSIVPCLSRDDENICISSVAFMVVDYRFCDEMKDENYRFNCKMDIAGENNDPDRDGLSNNQERFYNTDPFKADSDSDILSDLDEINKYFTNPSLPDTDGDGHDDAEELKNGYSPNERQKK